jgi:hypothetical protein
MMTVFGLSVGLGSCHNGKEGYSSSLKQNHIMPGSEGASPV